MKRDEMLENALALSLASIEMSLQILYLLTKDPEIITPWEKYVDTIQDMISKQLKEESGEE